MAGSASSALFHIAAIYSGRPGALAGATVTPFSDLRLLGDLQGIIDLDAKVPHRRLQLGVPKEQLYGSEVLRAPIDQRRLGPSHRVRPVVGTVQPQFIDLVPENPCVLARPEMGRFMETAGEEKVIRLQLSLFDPSLQGVAGSCRDLELDRALGLVLHYDRACRDWVAMADVSDLEGEEIASAQLTVDAQIEERKLAYAAPLHLEANAQRPDVLDLTGR